MARERNRDRVSHVTTDAPGAAFPTHWLPAVIGMALIGVFAWSYWPTLLTIVKTWDSHPDYNHGFLVVPLSLFMLYLRRDRFPSELWQPAVWSGVLVVAVACAIRWFAARLYIDSLDGWSLLVWLIGVVLAIGGWSVLRWAWPPLLFLAFMVPLPYFVESAVRLPLQRLATHISTYVLVVIGYPAIAEVNTIRIGASEFGVEDACAGLRIFVGILALASFFAITSRAAWWRRILLLAVALPVALAANSARIVATCVLHEQFSGELARRFSHDLAGYVMLPLAAAIFFGVLCYLNWLFVEIPELSMAGFVRGQTQRMQAKGPPN